MVVQASPSPRKSCHLPNAACDLKHSPVLLSGPREWGESCELNLILRREELNMNRRQLRRVSPRFDYCTRDRFNACDIMIAGKGDSPTEFLCDIAIQLLPIMHRNYRTCHVNNHLSTPVGSLQHILIEREVLSTQSGHSLE